MTPEEENRPHVTDRRCWCNPEAVSYRPFWRRIIRRLVRVFR